MLRCLIPIYWDDVKIFLYRDTLENWEKCDMILKDNEIAIIDMLADGISKVVLGDGKHKVIEQTNFKILKLNK